MMDKGTSGNDIRIADVLRATERMGADDALARTYALPGMRIHTFSRPAHGDSGDLHALHYLGGGRAALFIADIAGHEMASAIVATETLHYVEASRDRLGEPNAFLTRLGVDMFDKLNSVHRFLTAAVFLFNTEAGEVALSSAGHPQTVHYDAAANTAVTVKHTGLPVGFEKETEYEMVRLPFAPEDMLVIVTDGVSTAKNAAGDEFGYERIERIAVESGGDPGAALRALTKEIAAFGTTEATMDDLTVICAKRTAG